MRIMVFGQQFPDSLARNIGVTLRQMGHEVREVDDHLLGISQWWWQKPAALLIKIFHQVEEFHQRHFLRAARSWQPELIINACADLLPQVVARIKEETDALIVSWYPDAQSTLGRQYILKAPYDTLFFKDPYIVDFCRKKLEKPAFYLPECCNPMWHHHVSLTDEEQRHYGCDLTTAGNMYYYRALILEQFLDYDLKIWGVTYPRWLESSLARVYQYEFVAELEKAKAFNAAKVVLNSLHFGEIIGVNCRLFEVAGCGAFQIAEHRPGLAEFFEPEKEIVTYETKKELKDKVDYYLNRPRERQEIAARAYRRAQAEHTYEIRLEVMFSTLRDLQQEQ
jgi:spore maturation protein CgeB